MLLQLADDAANALVFLLHGLLLLSKELPLLQK